MLKGKSHKTHILIKGARVHNLKNIDVAIQRNKMTVITGLSGSGKSSLAFDTLYAEGQRRYVESLSSYARQFLGRLDKPDVDGIKGISPAIAIEQKVNTSNPRSTVGTSTEIYDFLKLMFARIGKTHSPISGKEVKRETATDVVDFLNSFEKGTKALILSPVIVQKDRTVKKQLEIFIDQGFSRVYLEGKIERIDKILDSETLEKNRTIQLLIDRLICDHESDENQARIGESAEAAFLEGEGDCSVIIVSEKEVVKTFSNKFELDGIAFTEPSVNFFTFNNPIGACPTCEGFGKVLGIDADLVIPNKNLSVYDDAVICWRGEKMQVWKNELVMNAQEFGFPIHKPFHELSKEQVKLIWTGNKFFSGLNGFFKYLESKIYKIQYRVMLSRYKGKTLCSDCNGNKLRKDASYVTVAGKAIMDIASLNIDSCKEFMDGIELNKHDQIIAKRLLLEINSRLQYLSDVGLGYLTLNRQSNSLSGGESQRINLATSLGSSLVGSMYILDEPSIGLHPRDTKRLLKVLNSLKNLGNTVIIVEHEEEVMKNADEIIDMGPMAGSHGGEVVFQGNHDDLIHSEKSLTAKYLTLKEVIPVPLKRRPWKNSITIEGARENNLKNLTVQIPLETLTVITGVSGSGKSTLIRQILYPALKKQLGGTSARTGEYDNLSGDFKLIEDIEFVDQNPIGKSSRSNPVTYVKAYDEIRALYSKQQISKINGFQPKHFSFNVEGGRCDACEGEGTIKVSMQFMADVYLECDSCNSRRFKDDVLEVRYKEKNIFDILCMTVDDAIELFSLSDERIEKRIVAKIQPLQDVGLGYIQLGQSSNTLSGGEAQRVKLASFLSKGKTQSKTLFIFDEPTTGLHFHDIRKLLSAVNALIEIGHSIVVIEHNAEIIKCADWVVDLGSEGGEQGGNIVFEGTPENLVNCNSSYTGEYLKQKLVITK